MVSTQEILLVTSGHTSACIQFESEQTAARALQRDRTGRSSCTPCACWSAVSWCTDRHQVALLQVSLPQPGWPSIICTGVEKLRH